MNPVASILMKLGSVAVFVIMQAIIKGLSDRIPTGEAVFFRSAFACPVIVVWLAWRHELATGFRTNDPLGHFWRGLAGTMAMGLSFAGLGLLPLFEVQAIGYAAPLLVVIFAAMFLGEQVRAFRLGTVALGLTGVLVILSPRMTAFGDGGLDDRESLGAALVLMSAICAALAQVFVRKLVHTETTSSIVFWFSVTAACLSLVTVPFGGVTPTPGEAALLVTAGLLGGVGQILLTSAYRGADASVVAPFDYSSILLALGIGFFVFGEVPTGQMLAGAGIVMAAGVLVIWRERRLGLERGKARRTMTPQG
jgi:drug/metabolite transporter (DMT)-like permease